MSNDIVNLISTKDISRNKKTRSGKERAFLGGRYVALIFLTFFAISPIYIMVVNSFKGITSVSQSGAWGFPTHLNFAAWPPVWDNLKGSMARTLFFVVQSSIISAIIGSINGYVFAKWRFRGSNFIFTTFLFGMFIPYQAVMIPLVRVATITGLNKSTYILVLAHVIYGIPICTLIFRNYFAAIPNELIEAARIDGAKEFVIYWRIILPSLRPVFFSTLMVVAHMAIKSFDLVMALTAGGPGYATDLPATFMYATAFTRGQIGVGAASATVMLATVAAIVVPYLYSELRAKK